MKPLSETDAVAALSVSGQTRLIHWWRRIRHAIRWRTRRLFGTGGHVGGFVPASCILRQTVSFGVAGRELIVEADFRTPLYEMVSEVVVVDCYGLSDLKTLKRSGDVIIDAGANIGVASLVMAAQFDCPVFAMEPVPENAEILDRNLVANREARVRILRTGLAGGDRNDRLWQDPAQSVSAHFSDIATLARPAGLRPIEAEFVSLRTVLTRHVTGDVLLLKMDIEGGEYEVIESLDPTTAGRVRAISLEVHDRGFGRNVRTISARLRALGYAVSVRPHIGNRRNLHYLLARRRQL